MKRDVAIEELTQQALKLMRDEGSEDKVATIATKVTIQLDKIAVKYSAETYQMIVALLLILDKIFEQNTDVLKVKKAEVH